MIDHPMAVGLLVKQADGLQLARADVELEIAGEILPGDVGRPAERSRVLLDDLFDVGEPISFGSFEALIQITAFHLSPRHPGSKHKRKSGQFFPRLAKIQLMMEVFGLIADDFITNEQSRGARRGRRIGPKSSQLDELGLNAESF